MAWRTDFREYLDAMGRSPKTVAAYGGDVDLFASWFEEVNQEAFSPGLLNSVDVREWRSHSLQIERVSARTWNRRMASMAVFSDWTVNIGHAKGDPMQGVKDVKLDSSLDIPRWLAPDEYRRTRRQFEIDINIASTDERHRLAIRDRALAWLMLGAGLRVSEAVKLRGDDLLLKNRSGVVHIRYGKGGKSAKIELGREARIALRAWLSICRDDQELVFQGVSTRQAQRRLKDTGSRARLNDALTPHRLRHTFVRRLAVHDDGTIKNPPAWVQMMARHSKPEITARYYQASVEDRQRMVENL